MIPTFDLCFPDPSRMVSSEALQPKSPETPCVEGITYLNLNPKSLNNDVYLEDQGTSQVRLQVPYWGYK